MAIWVNLNRAAKFPEVVKVYKRAGWGQGAQQSGSGTTQPYVAGSINSAPRGFLETVRKAVSLNSGAALPSWIRFNTASQDWQNCQVDVTAIPGVRPLNQNGKWRSFVA